MPFSTKETELLGHLTRRLGSDHQAEADAARDRIIQLLGKHGFNFNDYAEWLHAGASTGGNTEISEPQRENMELRNEVARLREEAADLKAELVALRGATGQQIVARSTVQRTSSRTGHPPAGHWGGLARTACLSLIAALPIGWLLAELRAPRLPTSPTTGMAGAGPSSTATPPFVAARTQHASGTDQAATSAAPGHAGSSPATFDPAAPSWKPPLGSRMAVVLEDGMVLSTPFPSRATEQEISRGTRVAILRQLVANGRQWAEVTCPTVSGYVPIDQLEVVE